MRPEEDEMAPQIPGYSICHHHRGVVGQGSDLYDFVTRDDGRIGVLIADFGRKSPEVENSVRETTGELHHLLQADPDPALVLGQLNQRLCGLHSNQFVTLLLAVLDPNTHEFTFANAGHLLPLVRRRYGRVENLDDRSSGLPLAIVPEFEYQRETVSLGPGDLLVLFTKGLSEALNRDRHLYGRARMHRMIAGAGTDPGKLVQAVAADMEDFLDGAPPTEDCTLLVIGRAQ